jgi:flagellar M-ring protein FliF
MSRQSALLRNRGTASASVLVNLFPGRRLESQQVAAITHLVASSVPDLEAARVTVIDQTGRLLSSPSDSDELGRSGAQFEYVNRGKKLCAPHRGPARAAGGAGQGRSRVNAAVDSPKPRGQRVAGRNGPLRSEQTAEDIQAGRHGPQNQAPAAAGCPADANGRARLVRQHRLQPRATAPAAEPSALRARAATDRSHVEPQAARARQPAQAVGANVDAGPAPRRRMPAALAPTAADIERMTGLVKQAVGFAKQRGDTVSVIQRGVPGRAGRTRQACRSASPCC